jgi:predicted RNA-binding Zn ribbon-like protein
MIVMTLTRRPPAPAPLDAVEAFVNSRELQTGAETLTTPAELAGWLAGHGLAGDDLPVTSDELARAVALREALRALLAANNDGPTEPAALAEANRALLDAGPVVRFLPGGHVELGAGSPGVPGALGHLLGIAFAAMTDGTWSRLKACREPRCQRAFYDYARNRSGVWCAMATCGSRAKMRAYYQRRHG